MFLPQTTGMLVKTELYVEGTKEMIECSGRGICNRLTGVCSCFNGYGSSDGQGNVGLYGDCGYITPLNA